MIAFLASDALLLGQQSKWLIYTVGLESMRVGGWGRDVLY
jgi:hypothetical protein